MKKLFCILLTVLLLSVSVSADVLWEPYRNDYYWKHAQSTTTVDARYEVPQGMTANIYSAPVNGKLIKTLEAGTTVYVGMSTVKHGEVWGVGYPLGDFETEGWFRLGRLQKQYSHEDFVNDHADSIAAEEAWLVAAEVGGDLYTWTYPGSGISDGVLPQEALEAASDYNNGNVSYGLVYTDPNGGKWGYIGYHMGHMGWMYLNDPTDPAPALELPLTIASTVTDTAAEGNTANPPSYPLVFSLVGVVIAATVLLLVHIRKKTP